MRGRVSEIVVDCREPAALVRFWAELLGGDPVDREPAWSYVDVPGFTRLAFQAVPEPKTGKNRLHLDVSVDELPLAAAHATALGATPVGDVVVDPHGSFQVMQDPEGNEFCLISD